MLLEKEHLLEVNGVPKSPSPVDSEAHTNPEHEARRQGNRRLLDKKLQQLQIKQRLVEKGPQDYDSILEVEVLDYFKNGFVDIAALPPSIHWQRGGVGEYLRFDMPDEESLFMLRGEMRLNDAVRAEWFLFRLQGHRVEVLEAFFAERDTRNFVLKTKQVKQLAEELTDNYERAWAAQHCAPAVWARISTLLSQKLDSAGIWYRSDKDRLYRSGSGTTHCIIALEQQDNPNSPAYLKVESTAEGVKLTGVFYSQEERDAHRQFIRLMDNLIALPPGKKSLKAAPQAFAQRILPDALCAKGSVEHANLLWGHARVKEPAPDTAAKADSKKRVLFK